MPKNESFSTTTPSDSAASPNLMKLNEGVKHHRSEDRRCRNAQVMAADLAILVKGAQHLDYCALDNPRLSQHIVP